MQPFNPNPAPNPQGNSGGFNPNDPNNFQQPQQLDQYGQPMMNFDQSQQFNQNQQPQGQYYPNDPNFQNPASQPGYSNTAPTGFDPYAPNIAHLDYNSVNQGQPQPNFDPYQQQPAPQAPSYDQPLMANEIQGVDPGFQEKKKGNNLFIIIAAAVAVILAIVLGVLIFLNFNRSSEGATNTSQSSSETQTVISTSSESAADSSSSFSSSGVVISQPAISSAASRSNISNSSSIRSSAANSSESVSLESLPSNDNAPTVVL